MGERQEKHEEQTNMEITFPSSNVLLEMAKDEYAKERERANSLDNKASFFITVIVAVATIFVPLIPYEKLLGVYLSEKCWQKCLISVLIAGVIVAFSFLIAAFKNLYDAYKLTNHMRPSLAAIEDEKFHRMHEDQTNKGLCDHYKTVVENNIKVNDKKCESLTAGIKLCGIGFLILTIATTLLQVITGG